MDQRDERKERKLSFLREDSSDKFSIRRIIAFITSILVWLLVTLDFFFSDKDFKDVFFYGLITFILTLLGLTTWTSIKKK